MRTSRLPGISAFIKVSLPPSLFPSTHPSIRFAIPPSVSVGEEGSKQMERSRGDKWQHFSMSTIRVLRTEGSFLPPDVIYSDMKELHLYVIILFVQVLSWAGSDLTEFLDHNTWLLDLIRRSKSPQDGRFLEKAVRDGDGGTLVEVCVFERGGYVILRRIRCPDKAIRSEVILQPRGLSALVPHSDELLTNGEQPKLVLYERFQICLLAGLLPPVFIGYMSPSIQRTHRFSGWLFRIKRQNGSKKAPLNFHLGLITINIQASPLLSVPRWPNCRGQQRHSKQICSSHIVQMSSRSWNRRLVEVRDLLPKPHHNPYNLLVLPIKLMTDSAAQSSEPP